MFDNDKYNSTIMEKICVGVDVDKKSIKVNMVHQDGEGTRKVRASGTLANDAKGFAHLAEWSAKHMKGTGVPSCCYVMEATGTYHEPLAHDLHGRGCDVHIVLPLKAKYYKKGMGIRSKTDGIDARALALMGCDGSLAKWSPPTPKLAELRSLTRQVESMQHQKTMLLNQLEAATHAAFMPALVKDGLDRMIGMVAKEIALLEKAVSALVGGDEVLEKKFGLLGGLKGVGMMTFAVVAAETNGFALFENQRQLTSYAGYDVVENQSGQRNGKSRISKRGNAHIRRIMHMASLSVVRFKVGTFAELQERIYKRSGVKMKGYVAVQRKLLCLMYTLWKKDEKFNTGKSGEQASGVLEEASLFPVAPAGGAQEGGHEGACDSKVKKVATQGVATQDGRPSVLSDGTLFPVLQI